MMENKLWVLSEEVIRELGQVLRRRGGEGVVEKDEGVERVEWVVPQRKVKGYAPGLYVRLRKKTIQLSVDLVRELEKVRDGGEGKKGTEGGKEVKLKVLVGWTPEGRFAIKPNAQGYKVRVREGGYGELQAESIYRQANIVIEDMKTVEVKMVNGKVFMQQN